MAINLPDRPRGRDGEIKKLLEENLALNEEIYKMVKKINRFVVWQRIFGFLKILIIVVPIVLGILYLPPVLKELLAQYQSILGMGQDLNPQNIDLNSLSPDLLKFIKK